MDWQPPPQNLAISTQEVHLWRAKLDLSSEQLNQFEQTLSEDELIRANRFRFSIHRDRFIAARGWLRQILSKYLSIAPSDIEFKYSDRGKPLLVSQKSPAKQLQFNVSHTEDIALYAVTLERLIGVDLEYLGKETEYQQIAQRFFTPAEAELINLANPDAGKRLFFQLWTVKEAYLKAIGSGLVGGLDSLELAVNYNSSDIKIVHFDDPAANVEDWSCHNLEMRSPFVASLVVKSDRQPLTIRQFCLNL